MEILTHNFRRDPNAMVHSAYVGVAPGMTTVTRVTALNKDADLFDTTKEYGEGIPRGQGGRIATLILGGVVTTLDEIEYIVQGIKEKKFVPLRKPGEISLMCQAVAERRNEQIKYWRKNPSEAPKAKPRRRGLYLPKGYRMVQTSEPGFRVAVRG